MHLDEMRDIQRHRGPDGAGSWWSADGCVGLAHRRLAILDLSPAGAQPMSTTDGSATITFNGEIYNHAELRTELAAAGYVFRGTSDTEVLLNAYHAWGDAAVDRLTGMFAFAIYDHRRNRLLLARDRVGEKPLFWCLSNGTLSFASELKGILARPGQARMISRDSLDRYLAAGSISAPGCIIDGVQKLVPGHVLVWDIGDGQPIIRKYWELPSEPLADSGAHAEELADNLHQLLRESIRRQLVADVPVGVLLSGGVDSSLITAIAAEVASGPLRTFTVGFPGHVGFDERPFAAQVARQFGTQHIEIEAQAGSLDLIDALARQFDEPMCDSSMIPTYLVSAVVRKHCTVVLGGDGGDELFGGYKSYQGALRLVELLGRYPRPLRLLVSGIANRIIPTGFSGRNGLIALGKSLDDASMWGNFFDRRTRVAFAPILDAYHRSAKNPGQMPLRNMRFGCPGAWMHRDFQTYLPDDILTKVDRASMLNSLEIRAPFLDHAICEWAFSSIPNRLRANKYQRKIIPSTLAKRLLGERYDAGRKQGFSVPLKSWLIDESGKVKFFDEIAGCDLFKNGSLSYRRFAQIAHRAPERAFCLIFLARWCAIYKPYVSEAIVD